HSLQASSSGDGVGSQPKVPDKPKGKTIESGDDDDDDDSDDDGNDDGSDDDGGDND
ncbi:hypothetical protein Tco_0621206, partial [Tanacetum coccineum]